MSSITKKGLFLFWTFFKGMMFAFTSGMAALPAIEKAIVDEKKWLTDQEFWTYPTLGQTLPGVISIHNAMLIGNRIAGPFGAFMAVTGTVMPAFVCMLVIAVLFQTVVDNPYIQGAIRGIRVVSVVLLLGNSARLLRNSRKDLLSLILVISAAAAPLFFRFSAFWTIVLCGLAGILSIFINPGEAENDPEGNEGTNK